MAIKDSVTDALAPLMEMLTDGWLNLKTGFGDPRRDKRVHTVPTIDPLSPEDCAILYRSSDILQKVVDEPATTAFRKGWAIKLNEDDDDKEHAEEIDAAIKKLAGYTKTTDAIRWRAQFGGGALFVGCNDGQSAHMPLIEDRIKTIDFLTALDARECRPIDWYDNASHPKYGQPRLYEVTPLVPSMGQSYEAREKKPTLRAGTIRVHESRIIPFSGPRSDRRMLVAGVNGWGDSIYQRVWQHVADFDTAISSSSVLMAEFAQPVFKIRGLASLMASDREDVVKKRIELLNLSRSVIRGILIDAEGEDYSRNAVPLSGVEGVMLQLAQRVASATDYPMSLLFGQAAAGLNATGDSDIRFWYDRINALQVNHIQPGLTRLVELICFAKDGPTKGKPLTDWTIEPNSLWQEPDKEQAETHLVQAQADQIYIDRGVVTPAEIRSSRFKGDGYSLATQLEAEAEDSETDDEVLSTEGAPRIDPATGLPVQVPQGSTPGAPGAAPIAQGGAPGAPGAAPMGAPAAGGAPSIQDTALNGTQVTSMIEVVTSVVKGLIPRESGSAILQRAFLMKPEDAENLLGPKEFKPTPDPIEEAKAEALKNPKPMPGAPGAQPPGAKPAPFGGK